MPTLNIVQSYSLRIGRPLLTFPEFYLQIPPRVREFIFRKDKKFAICTHLNWFHPVFYKLVSRQFCIMNGQTVCFILDTCFSMCSCVQYVFMIHYVQLTRYIPKSLGLWPVLIFKNIFKYSYFKNK